MLAIETGVPDFFETRLTKSGTLPGQIKMCEILHMQRSGVADLPLRGGGKDSALKPLPAGSVYSEPGGVNHFARTTDTPVVVHISGYGPTDTRYFILLMMQSRALRTESSNSRAVVQTAINEASLGLAMSRCRSRSESLAGEKCRPADNARIVGYPETI